MRPSILIAAASVFTQPCAPRDVFEPADAVLAPSQGTTPPPATPVDTADTALVDDTADTGAPIGVDTDVPVAIDVPYDLPSTPFDYGLDVPPHLQTTMAVTNNTPANNRITDAGATLGRVLFYDTLLSANDTVACASCHAADQGFSDDAALSTGFAGGLTGRHSMPIVNIGFYRPGRMFWDERAPTLEAQVLMPIQDTTEMGLTLAELEMRVADVGYYEPLFVDAFGDADVTAPRIGRALAQFVRSITSFDSRWDQGVAAAGNPQAPFPNFTAQENRGKAIFFGIDLPVPGPGCNVCHLPPLPGGGGPGAGAPNLGNFYMPAPRNNGLPDADDEGVGGGAFKSPTLRNVALRGSYMHDGRFTTLAEVVEFYDNGVVANPNLDPALRAPAAGRPGPGGPGVIARRMNLSQADKDALVAFLKTLSDEGSSMDPRFSDPFVE